MNISSPTPQNVVDRIVSIQARLRELAQELGITTGQVILMLQVMESPPQPFNPGVNAILTARAKADNPFVPNVLNEDHPPHAGAEDVKETEAPSPFDGSPEDARPFLNRIEAWFTLLPHQYRLTRTRIISTCRLITTSPASAWAQSVSLAICNYDDDPAYCDNWQDFCAQFLESFGIPNEREDALDQITRFCQEELELSVFIAEFQRLKNRAEISEEFALREFRRGVREDIFEAVSQMVPVPSTLQGWIQASQERDLQLRDMEEFKRANRLRKGKAKAQSSPSSSSYYEPQVTEPRDDSPPLPPYVPLADTFPERDSVPLPSLDIYQACCRHFLQQLIMPSD